MRSITMILILAICETIYAGKITGNASIEKENNAFVIDQNIIVKVEKTTPYLLDTNIKNANSEERVTNNRLINKADELDAISAAVPESSKEETVIDIVTTTLGPVRGYYLYEDLNILSYIDLPYGRTTGIANPPQEAEPWEEIHQVSSHTKKCLQLDEVGLPVGEADCLTLSVIVPKNVVNAGVLFYIHDGKSGDPKYYGPEYLVPKDIIVVLPNYRLGPFGFLCLHHEDAPGNAGLKDLSLALEWTVKNIRKFGGDPRKITVSGEGTVSALVGLLSLSSKSRGFIDKAILESGSPISHWTLDRDPMDTGSKLMNSIANASENETIILSERNHTEILQASKGIQFKPCIEKGPKAFLNQTPWSILTKDQINIKFLIGTASHAGAHDVSKLDVEELALLDKNNTLLIPDDVTFKNETIQAEVAELIKCQYFGVGGLNLNDVERLTLYYTDMSYLSPALRTARYLVRAGATVYLYEFSFLGTFNKKALSLPFETKGAVKGDIVGYLFAENNEYPLEDSPEYEMMKLITDFWASFITDGVPSSKDITWNNLTVTSEKSELWLSIGAEVEQRKGVHVDRMKLWTDLYNKHFENKGVSTRASLAITVAFILVIGIF